MSSELAPSIVIPLDAPLVGGVAEPTVAFAGSPPALFIAEPTWDADWGRWVAWHAPDIAAVALMLAIVVTAWLLLRLARRVRRSGGLYCRACNHELSLPQVKVGEDGKGVWASEDAKCPECGKRDARGPVRGRRARGKVIAVIAIGVVVCAACVVTLASTLRIGGNTTPRLSETWPVAGLERVMGSWSLKRRSFAMWYQAIRFSRVDPATDTREEIGTVDTSMPRMFNFVSGDGKYVVATSHRDNALVVIDVVTKKRKEVSFDAGGTGFRGYLMVVQFSEDSSHAFVSNQGRKGTARRDELFSVDLATSAAKSIAVVEHEAESGPTGTDSYSQFLVAEAGADVVWVHQVSKRGKSIMREEIVLRWESDGGRRERQEKAPGEMLMARISDDGKICVLETGMNRKTWAFALADEKDVQDVPARSPKTRDVPRRFLVMPDKTGTAIIRDIGAFALPRATLRVKSAGYPQFELSNGERFVAAIGDRDIERNWISRMLGAPALKGWEVRIWDLQPLLDQKFGEERPVPKKK